MRDFEETVQRRCPNPLRCELPDGQTRWQHGELVYDPRMQLGQLHGREMENLLGQVTKCFCFKLILVLWLMDKYQSMNCSKLDVIKVISSSL